MSMEGEGYDEPAYQPADQPEYNPTILNKHDGSRGASRNQAQLARAEWDDYKARFVPIEDELISQIGDRGVYRDSVSRATQAVDTAYRTGAGETRRGLSRYGSQQSATEQQQMGRQMGLSKALASTEAVNRTRAAVKDRDLNVMGGGLSPASQRNTQG